MKEAPDDSYYRILIEKSQDEIVAKLEESKAAIEKGDLKPWEFRGMKAIWFGRHLYQPLLCLDQNIGHVGSMLDVAVAAENRPARLPDGAPLDDAPSTSAE
jgi:hypothetical protein